MKKMIAIAAVGVLFAGCGEKLDEIKQAAEAAQAVAEAAPKLEQAANEAETFMNERRAKGDTVAMPADQLKAFLPTSVDGYRPKEEPSINQTSMGEFSFSTAEQVFVATTGDTNNPAEIKVSLTDWGGTEGGYGLYYLPFAMNVKTENAQERSGTVDLDIPYTAAMEKFDKQSKSSSLMVATRYRYLINLEANNQTEDQTALLKSIAIATAERFKDK